MNDQSYFHWDLFRPALHSPSFSMGGPFLDIREDPMRMMQGKAACKPFSLDQSCAFWSKEIGLDGHDGLQNMGGRVLEIRKEKSRDAARSRRGKENYEFYELAKLLPLPAAITSQLDKASIIRLSISYLKLRDFCGHGDPPWNRDGHVGGQRRGQTGVTADLFELHQGAHILQSLDGFAFALSNDGRFIYISETVSIYLGLSQVEMAGCSIFDYIHAQDHQEMADQLGLSLASVSSTLTSPSSPTVDSPTGTRAVSPLGNERVPLMSPDEEKTPCRSFCIRMKSTLTKRGVHTRTSGYRVLMLIGQFRPQVNFSSAGRKCAGPLLGLTGVAIALPPPSITELRIEADTFIMRLTADFKVIYCENVIQSLTDWRCDDISGKDLYSFCHPGDAHLLKKMHKDLLLKGQVLSPSIRLLNKGGGYIWTQICCTSLFTSKTSDDQTVLAIFQTISNVEHRGVVLDTSQLPLSDRPVAETSQPEELELLTRTDDILKTSAKCSHPRSSRETQDDSDPVRVDPNIFSPGIDNDFVLDNTLERDDDTFKHDGRLSRRKTERPRKRKRETDDHSVAFITDEENSSTSIVLRHQNVSDRIPLQQRDGDTVLNLSSSNQSVSNSPGNDVTNSSYLSQQGPEDLSISTVVHKSRLSASKSAGIASNNLSSSVHELEKAMTRHLPARSKGQNSHQQSQQRSPVEPHWSPFSFPVSTLSFTSGSYSTGTIHTNRESVIRSNLSGKLTGVNGEVENIGLVSPSSSDVTLTKDQLQLHIPHISVNSKHIYNSHKDSVSVPDEFGITPPSSVSPQEKMINGPYPDTDINSDCLGMRVRQTVNSSGKCHYPSMSHPANEMTKQHFLSVPSYAFSAADLGAFAHTSSQAGGVVLDPRAVPNNGLWYGNHNNT